MGCFLYEVKDLGQNPLWGNWNEIGCCSKVNLVHINFDINFAGNAKKGGLCSLNGKCRRWVGRVSLLWAFESGHQGQPCRFHFGPSHNGAGHTGANSHRPGFGTLLIDKIALWCPLNLNTLKPYPGWDARVKIPVRWHFGMWKQSLLLFGLSARTDGSRLIRIWIQNPNSRIITWSIYVSPSFLCFPKEYTWLMYTHWLNLTLNSKFGLFERISFGVTFSD